MQGGAVSSVVGGVGRLNGQLTNALQVIADGGQAALSGLSQRDAVVGIANGSCQAADVGCHAGADGQASSVVFGRVDANARRQTLHGCCLIQAAGAQRILSCNGADIGVDN